MPACRYACDDLWRATRMRDAKHLESAYSLRLKQSQKAAQASACLHADMPVAIYDEQRE